MRLWTYVSSLNQRSHPFPWRFDQDEHLHPTALLSAESPESLKRISHCLMEFFAAICTPFLSCTSGRSTSNLLGNRLMTASSKSNGLLVAPMTTTRLSLFAMAELSPSISCMNSVRMRLCDMLPDDPRDIRAPKSASTSSRNTTHGERRRARENTALTLRGWLSEWGRG